MRGVSLQSGSSLRRHRYWVGKPVRGGPVSGKMVRGEGNSSAGRETGPRWSSFSKTSPRTVEYLCTSSAEKETRPRGEGNWSAGREKLGRGLVSRISSKKKSKNSLSRKITGPPLCQEGKNLSAGEKTRPRPISVRFRRFNNFFRTLLRIAPARFFFYRTRSTDLHQCAK